MGIVWKYWSYGLQKSLNSELVGLVILMGVQNPRIPIEIWTMKTRLMKRVSEENKGYPRLMRRVSEVNKGYPRLVKYQRGTRAIPVS